MASDPLHTKLCDMFGLEFPIVAFTHCKDVAAAVSNAGGLGVLGELGRAPDEIAADIKWMKEHTTGKAWGVDLVFPASTPATANREDLDAQIPDTHKAFVRSVKDKWNIPEAKPIERKAGAGGGLFSQEAARRQLDAVLESHAPLLVAGLGSPAFVLDAAHAQGMMVGGLVGKTRQARREVEAGVDLIVAQGYDAGGHTGEIGTFTLVPQVVDLAGDTPVLAAGGVGTGRHLAAALCMGAVGVWSGTLWLATRESDTDIIVKEKILAATEDDTIRSRALTGKPARQLKNQWLMEWEEPGAPKTLPMPLQGMLANEILQAARENHMEAFMGTPAGQVVGIIKSIKPCREVIYDMVDEAREVFERLTGMTAGVAG